MGRTLRNGKTIFQITKQPSDEWQPDADMIWAKSVCENDVQEGSFPYGKFLAMTDNEQSTTVITIPSNGSVKTSDGSYYTYATSGSSVTHTWDDTNARQSEVGNYKVRWLIYYFGIDNVILNVPIRTLYVCCNGAIKIRTASNYLYSAFAPLLKYIELINGSYFIGNFSNIESNIEKIDYAFGTSSLNTAFINQFMLKELNIKPLNDTIKPTNLTSFVSTCRKLQKINGLNSLDVSNVTNMSNMFRDDISLQELDLSNWNTSNVTYASFMFYNCRSLQKIEGIDNWDTSNITDMEHMFGFIGTTEISLSNFNTGNATNMSGMFSGWLGTKINLANFNTSKVTNMSSMFSASLLEEINLSNFDFSSCENMGTMFSNNYYLKKIIGLDVSSVTNLDQTFLNCYLIEELNLNSHNVTNFYNAFGDCQNLKTLSLDLNSCQTNYGIFSRCSNLEFLTLTNIKISINIASSSKYSRETLLGIINNLVDLTGQTAQTLTIGSANLAKLTDEDKQIATNKNWTLAS